MNAADLLDAARQLRIAAARHLPSTSWVKMQELARRLTEAARTPCPYCGALPAIGPCPTAPGALAGAAAPF